MVDRSEPLVVTPQACPFVALDGDRDQRLDRARPDAPLLRGGDPQGALHGPPGELLPVTGVHGLPHLPGLGLPGRGGRRARAPAAGVPASATTPVATAPAGTLASVTGPAPVTAAPSSGTASDAMLQPAAPAAAPQPHRPSRRARQSPARHRPAPAWTAAPAWIAEATPPPDLFGQPTKRAARRPPIRASALVRRGMSPRVCPWPSLRRQPRRRLPSTSTGPSPRRTPPRGRGRACGVDGADGPRGVAGTSSGPAGVPELARADLDGDARRGWRPDGHRHRGRGAGPGAGRCGCAGVARAPDPTRGAAIRTPGMGGRAAVRGVRRRTGSRRLGRPAAHRHRRRARGGGRCSSCSCCPACSCRRWRRTDRRAHRVGCRRAPVATERPRATPQPRAPRPSGPRRPALPTGSSVATRCCASAAGST